MLPALPIPTWPLAEGELGVVMLPLPLGELPEEPMLAEPVLVEPAPLAPAAESVPTVESAAVPLAEGAEAGACAAPLPAPGLCAVLESLAVLPPMPLVVDRPVLPALSEAVLPLLPPVATWPDAAPPAVPCVPSIEPLCVVPVSLLAVLVSLLPLAQAASPIRATEASAVPRLNFICSPILI